MPIKELNFRFYISTLYYKEKYYFLRNINYNIFICLNNKNYFNTNKRGYIILFVYIRPLFKNKKYYYKYVIYNLFNCNK